MIFQIVDFIARAHSVISIIPPASLLTVAGMTALSYVSSFLLGVLGYLAVRSFRE